MKTLHLLIIFCLIFGAFTPSWASVELNAYLAISGEPVKPQFKFSKLVTFTYPLGGKLKSLLIGQNRTISFTEEADKNQSVKKLMDDINSQLATGSQAITTITNLRVDYQAKVTGGSYHTDIEYSVTLIPTLTNYVLNQGLGDNPTVLDASWMSFNENGPVIITTQEYGDLEINYLIGFIKSQLPEVYDIIKGTDAETALQQNLIDSSLPLNASLGKWDSLFDPSYTLTQTGPVGQELNKIAVTTFASGFGFGEKHSARIGGAEFGTDSDYHLDITEQRNVGTVNVQGHANPYNMQGKWAFSTTMQSAHLFPTCCAYSWYDAIPSWGWVVIAGTVIGVLLFVMLRRHRG